MKIVFMGTPDFAAGALEALFSAGYEITCAVTQPDKPKGRSGQLQPPPVKECALRHGIPVLQPVRIKKPEAVAELKKYEADVYIVAAFGQILSQEILDIPQYGCLNIHASLLPKYRGSSPIQHVILNGEKETGITIMQMDAGIDTGDMLYKKSIPIESTDTFEALHDKLMKLGGEAICEALPLLEAGRLTPVKQCEEDSCHAPLIAKNMGLMDFTKEASSLERLVRGMNPWPSAYTTYKGRQLKVWRAESVEASCASGQDRTSAVAPPGVVTAVAPPGEITAVATPGEIIAVGGDYIEVACGSGALRIYELQLEGKKRMSTHDFLLGMKMHGGEILG